MNPDYGLIFVPVFK